MLAHLNVGDLFVDVNFKDIKNVHLSVHPPTGRVTVSAPRRTGLETIRVFAITKLGWIRRQQRKLREQPRETAREFLANESHYVWGKRYLLRVVESKSKPSVTASHSNLILRVPARASVERKDAVLARWYREQVKAIVPALITRWAPLVGVEVDKVTVQRMKTKWGSCSHRSRSIRLNTDLAKKPKECLEYVLLHEMVHLLEPTHNARFTAAMDRLMRNWRLRRDLLNELPVSHQEWQS